MASDSSPPNFNNGHSSPDDSISSPIGNTLSSPGDAARHRGIRRSSTPSAFTSDDAPMSSEGGEGYNADDIRPTFVWGTNISVEDVNEAIQRFLKHFMEQSSQSDGLHMEGKYETAIKQVIEIEGDSLDVDSHDVFDYDPDWYTKMVRYPLEVLAILDLVLMNMVSRINPLFEKHIQTRIFKFKTSASMRNLNPTDIERMVSLKGMIIRFSSIIPEIREVMFRCLVCGCCSEPVAVERGRLSEPTKCPREECQAKNSMTLVHNRCSFTDKQIVRLQETRDEIPEGGTPHTVSLLMHDKLVDAGKPGDRVEVAGIYRAMSVRVGPTQRTVKSLFKTFIECLHIKKTEKSRMLSENAMDVETSLGNRNTEEIHFDEEKVAQLKELSKQPDIYERLTKSLAPNIWELDDVKKGLLCELFGGNALKLASGAASVHGLEEEEDGDLEPMYACIDWLPIKGAFWVGVACFLTSFVALMVGREVPSLQTAMLILALIFYALFFVAYLSVYRAATGADIPHLDIADINDVIGGALNGGGGGGGS